ncbi:MAG: tetratricopeptide repeat protein [Pseudomonadota bacterium]
MHGSPFPRRLPALLCLLLASLSAPGVLADDTPRTVIGPVNVDLADGAAALRAGDGKEGLRLTLRGLEMATSERDRHAAWANLCAAYLILGQADDALAYCNRVLEADSGNWRAYNNRAIVYIQTERYAEAAEDIRRAEAIRPNSATLADVKRLLRDKTHPVTPSVTVDDRRDVPDDSP